MNLTKVLELTAPKLDELQKEHIYRIEQEIKKRPSQIEISFKDTLNRLCGSVVEEQKKKQKNPIRYIVFSFMYSNLIREKHALRISAYDSNFWNDEKEIALEWDILPFFQGSKEEYKTAMNILSSNYIKILPNEEAELYRGYLMDYYKLAFTYMALAISEITSLNNFKEMKKEDKLTVLLGEYRDKTQTIWEYEV